MSGSGRAPRLVLVAAVLLLLGAPAAVRATRPPSGSATVGALTQLAGKEGCLVDVSRHRRGCAPARGLRGAAPFVGSHAITVSPDGRDVYVAASSSDAIAVFARDRRTGALRQPAGSGGCIAAGAASGCAPAVGLDAPNSVVVSPDGRNVYATARTTGSVVTFTRNRTTGALTQATTGSCTAAVATPRCSVGRALAAADAVTVSPDGRSVYVAAFAGNAVAVFSRDASSGALTQPAGAGGCVVNVQADGCATGVALAAPEGITVSPDGRSVYVASALSNALVTLARTRSTGALTQPAGAAGCIVTPAMPGCSSGRALGGADAVAVSPDGASVYVSSLLTSGVAAFTRHPRTGALAQATGRAGCLSARRVPRCAAGRALKSAEGVAVSPDGASVYVASFSSDAIGVLARDRASGTIAQLPGRAGCLSAAGQGCSAARGIDGVSSIAISPDGRNAYAAAFASSAVTVFRRHP